MIFESHAHYDDERFDKDRADILGNIGSNGLDVVINVGASMLMNEATDSPDSSISGATSNNPDTSAAPLKGSPLGARSSASAKPGLSVKARV